MGSGHGGGGADAAIDAATGTGRWCWRGSRKSRSVLCKNHSPLLLQHQLSVMENRKPADYFKFLFFSGDQRGEESHFQAVRAV